MAGIVSVLHTANLYGSLADLLTALVRHEIIKTKDDASLQPFRNDTPFTRVCTCNLYPTASSADHCLNITSGLPRLSGAVLRAIALLHTLSIREPLAGRRSKQGRSINYIVGGEKLG